MDISGIEGLTEAQTISIMGLFKTSSDEAAVSHKEAISAAVKVETEGLKKKNSELLAEKKAVQDKNTQAQKEREESDMAAKDKAVKDATTFEEVTKALAERDKLIQNQNVSIVKAKQDAEEVQKNFTIERNNATLSQAVKDLSSKFVVRDNPAANMYMSTLYKDGLEVRDGGVFPKDKTVTYDQFVSNINDAKENASYIVGTGGSGGGAPGNQSNGRAETNTMSAEKFNQLDPLQKHEFIVGGGKPVD